MTADERQYFGARTGSLPEVGAFVERRCAELGVPRDTALRLRLIAEELFINAVDHGYGGDSESQVTLALTHGPDGVVLVQEDQGREFNPFQGVTQVTESGDPDRRGVGGLGRVLVVNLSARHAYKRVGDTNRVTVTLGAAVTP